VAVAVAVVALAYRNPHVGKPADSESTTTAPAASGALQ